MTHTHIYIHHTQTHTGCSTEGILSVSAATTSGARMASRDIFGAGAQRNMSEDICTFETRLVRKKHIKRHFYI